MKHPLLMLLAASACVDGGPGEPSSPRPRLNLVVALTEDVEQVELYTLGVHIDEVSVEALGANGTLSAAGLGAVESTLLEDGASASAYIELDARAYDQAWVRCELREAGDRHALWATGRFEDGDEDEDEGVPFDLEVRPTLTLDAHVDLDLRDGQDVTLRFELDPDAWFDDLELDDLPPVLRLEPQSGETYDEVVQRIVESTEGKLTDD